jgi:hypothetical protein
MSKAIVIDGTPLPEPQITEKARAALRAAALLQERLRSLAESGDLSPGHYTVRTENHLSMVRVGKCPPGSFLTPHYAVDVRRKNSDVAIC